MVLFYENPGSSRQKMSKMETKVFVKTAFGIVEGDMVYPNFMNPSFTTNLGHGFPWRVHKVFSGVGIVLERPSRNGKIRLEKWFAGYWQKEIDKK